MLTLAMADVPRTGCWVSFLSRRHVPFPHKLPQYSLLPVLLWVTAVAQWVMAVGQWAKAPGIHCYVAGSIPAVTPRYCTKKIEKCSLKHKKKQRKKNYYGQNRIRSDPKLFA